MRYKMSNNVIDAQVSKLIEENNELKDRLREIEKTIEKNQKDDVHDIKEILNSIKEFNEKMAWLLSRKDWIDKIIEKIKKILPI